MAFTRATRNVIHRRARSLSGGYSASEISGRTGEIMQCAHIDHDKQNPDYDNPENGFLCTLTEHLIDHYLREGENGLCKEYNRNAIKSLKNLITSKYGALKLGEVYSFTRQMDAYEQWIERLEELRREWQVLV